MAATPVGLYFWYVDRFGVNVPVEDSWNTIVPLLKLLAAGRLTLAALWAPHNESRMLVPFALTLAIDWATRMNSRAVMLVSACLLTASLLLIGVLAVRSLRVDRLWLIPVALLTMGLVQFGNALWAFQLAWYLAMFLTLAALATIEMIGDRWLGLGLALVPALLASYCSLQGLLVWPLALLYGAALGWRWRHALCWVAVGVAATVAYLWNFGPLQPASHPLLGLREPGKAIDFAARLVGQMYPFHHALLGGLTVLASLAVIALVAREGRDWTRFRLPLALLVLGLLFDLMVTVGRLPLGTAAAGASRYTTYNLLLLVGVCLGAAGLAAVRWRRAARIPMLVVATAALGLVAVQIAGDIPTGIQAGQTSLASRTTAAQLLLHWRSAPSLALGTYLFAPGGGYVKVWAPVLEQHHWSVFA